MMHRFVILALLPTACAPVDETPGGSSESSGSESEGGSSESGESEGSSSSEEDGSSSEGDPLDCDHPGQPMFAACGSGCGNTCAEAFDCRENYAGGYLAECEAPCETDADCDAIAGVHIIAYTGPIACSAGYCVVPCGPDGECAEGTTCYPGTLVDGTPIADPLHPLAHCMPKAK